MPTDVRVLISGESGTGKECIARAIHDGGPRKNGPFVAVDCGALPANLLESELFGYVKGAFTGADRDRKGLFEEAHGGTLFLDEIVNLPMELQAKMLRAIQESEIRPLGSSQVRKVDARIIAAASENVRDEMIAGKFRRDLFYRLNVVNINLPALRERKEDIPLLAEHFLSTMNKKYGKRITGFHADTMAHLAAYAWPGNIRELEHAMERAVVLCQSDLLRQTDFPFFETPPAESDTLFQPRPWDEAVFALKRQYLANILKHTGGAKKPAAEILQIQPTYLSRLLKNLRIEE
jgi:transcriptional regulator with PAS, ATPase and Fis domain